MANLNQPSLRGMTVVVTHFSAEARAEKADLQQRLFCLPGLYR